MFFAVSHNQCDQIMKFIGLWATIQSLWQQLISPNLLHTQAIFIKVSKSLIFLVKSFWGNFYRHLAIFSGHSAHNQVFYLSKDEDESTNYEKVEKIWREKFGLKKAVKQDQTAPCF